MESTRRQFLRTTGLAAGAAGLAAARTASAGELEALGRSGGPQRLLFLGGTGFLGPAMVEVALGRGHEVTVFNRGKTNTHLFPEIERLVGDRHGDLEALEGERAWDAVIDTTAYVPAHVEATAGMLKDRCEHYTLLSSVSAYADHSQPHVEGDPVAEISDEEAAKLTTIRESLAHYGAMKARCEKAAEAAFVDRTLVVRPGLIVGPLDRSDRFTYWAARVAKGGEVLSPGDGSDPVQLVDVRDLGRWIIDCVERRETGLFNGISPAGWLTMAGMLYGIRAAFATDARLTWVSAEFLEEREVQPWTDLPVWVPAKGELAAFHLVSTEKAVAAGLTFRPLAETARDTVEWFGTLPEERRGKTRAGLTAQRETELLAAWHAAQAPAPAKTT